jgi:aminoacyl tRNA synthase complex-interacting multifunctional protein 1
LGKQVVVITNLKPVKMRGVASEGMVLCASSERVVEGETVRRVECVEVPEGSEPGDVLFFEGYKGIPDEVLKVKEKVWETVQQGFVTTVNGVPGYCCEGSVAVLRSERGPCLASTIVDGVMK